MSPLLRWCRFNVVGAMGMAVQLGSLAVFNRILHGHYLLASAIAIELTLLHNFTWHTRYTWRDRVHDSPRLRQLVRFHLANGVVSMGGNLVLLRALVGMAKMPVLPADLIAIVCCSIANYLLGDGWAFAPATRQRPLRVEGAAVTLGEGAP